MPNPARIAATAMSGQAVPVPNTPNAAATTAMLPTASLREQIHTDRRLASPSRCRQSISAQARLAISANTPMIPIVAAWGSVPMTAIQIVLPSTHKPSRSSVAPLSSAARAPLQGEAGNAQADCIVGAVSQEVERVGLEGRRLRGEARSDLDREHAGVDRQRKPQHAPPGLVSGWRGRFTPDAASACHVVTSICST
jgi:hypothetical protein